MKISRFIFAFLITFVLWTGLTLPFTTEKAIVGIGVAILVGIISIKFLKSGLKALSPVRLFHIIIYIPVFFIKMVIANIEIAFIVLNPKLPIEPSIIKAKTELKNDISMLWLANSITLTPGTLTVDVRDGEFYIHCVKPTETTSKWLKEKVLYPFEKHLKGGIDGS